jgi:hypothetical protein
VVILPVWYTHSPVIFLLIFGNEQFQHTIMAPGKQSVLSSTFFKHPKLKTVKKHKKLERQATGLPAVQRTKPKVDKKKAEELKREKVVADGAAGWRRYLHDKGDPDADTIRTDTLFHSFGPAPPDRSPDHFANHDSDAEYTSNRSDESV